MDSETPLVCTDGIIPVRAEADPRSERLTDLLFGEEFLPRSEHAEFLFGTTMSDGIEGFAPAASLVSKSDRATHQVRRTFIHIYRAPDLTMAVGKVLPMNALVSVTGRSAAVRYPGGGPGSTVVQLRSGGWVTEQGLVPIGHYQTDVQMVARMFTGAVYLHGGKTWLGCDGPGLIQTVLCACGFSVPRRLKQQVDYLSQKQPTNAEDHPIEGSLIYSDTSCGFLFNEEIVAARTQTMLVDASSHANFLEDAAGPVRVFPLNFPRS
jgi:hypothetical protein